MSNFKLGPLQEEWVQSLEQHPERQMIQRLGRKNSDGSYRACCLGQAGLIAVVCEWNEDGDLVVKGGGGYALLERNSYKAMGLRSPSGFSKGTLSPLAVINDSGATWPEIAALIRANPEEYFTHSV